MPEVCKSLIDDYITGILEVADLEDALAGIFGDTPSSHINAQNHLQKLYESDQIDSNGFSEISHLISRVNIKATIKKNPDSAVIVSSERSGLDDDQTLILTDITDLTDLTEDGSS
ncbi:MAG: hypothetical protein O7D36_02445, partial [Gammaproteobacteria bacterium]|nr:hypothetical protein [Gammaproteobacteria bacterium]